MRGGSKRRKVKKVCTKCLHEGLYLPRERICQHRKFGPHSYWCGGSLKAKAPQKHLTALAQQREQRALVHAQRQVRKTRTRIKRLTTALRKWERRVRHYERRLVMSDEHRQAERARLKKASQVRSVRQRLTKAAAGLPDVERDFTGLPVLPLSLVSTQNRHVRRTA